MTTNFDSFINNCFFILKKKIKQKKKTSIKNNMHSCQCVVFALDVNLWKNTPISFYFLTLQLFRTITRFPVDTDQLY